MRVKVCLLYLYLAVLVYGSGCAVIFPAVVGGGVAMKTTDVIVDQQSKQWRTIRVKTANLTKLKQDIGKILEAEGYKVYDSGKYEIKLERENCFRIRFTKISEYIKLEISDCSFLWNQFPGGKMDTGIEKGVILDRIRKGLIDKYKILI